MLKSIAVDNHVLQQDSKVPSFLALVYSLESTPVWQPTDQVYNFLDNCIQRLVKRPLKYMGDMEAYAKISNDQYASGRLSLLFVVIAEQWPFYLDRNSSADAKDVALWIARFLTAAGEAGENWLALRNVKKHLSKSTKPGEARRQLDASLGDSASKMLSLQPSFKERLGATLPAEGPSTEPTNVDATTTAKIELFNAEIAPPTETDDHPGLYRWLQVDITDALSDGAIGDLILCLSSSYEEVRRQALPNVRLCMSKLKAAPHGEWEQVHLLLGEVAETATGSIEQEPLPFFAGVLAARSIAVLSDPMHAMFNKLNLFLTRGPTWKVAKLPSYWIDRILLQPPEIDDRGFEEADWLLEVMIDGLRTAKVGSFLHFI